MAATAPAPVGTGAVRSRRRVLLTVSGVIAPDLMEQVADGRRPCPDYVELAEAMDADVLDVTEARRRTGRSGQLAERLGGRPFLLAWACYRERKHYEAIFTDGEQVGLPLAMLERLTLRRAGTHVMVVHILSVKKKVLPYRVLRLGRYIDTMLVYASAQKRFIVDELGFPAERVVLTPFMVDAEFFAPGRVTAAPQRPMICTAGLELRDYETLMTAVDGLDVGVVIAAASPWSKRPDTTQGADLPANVETCSLGFVDLRQLYADAQFVVMPLHETDFQAGVTTILEAMAMGKPVVCTRTTGQTDVVVDRVTGVYVQPGDAAGLRAAIEGLLGDPERVARMGAAARAFIEEQGDVRVYARRLGDVVAGVVRRRSSR